MSPLLADIVAKVFLHRWPKILRAVDATFVLGCGGPHRLTENSRATSVTCLRVHESAVVSRIDFWRENYHRAISDFCNNIGTKRRTAASHNSVRYQRHGRQPVASNCTGASDKVPITAAWRASQRLGIGQQRRVRCRGVQSRAQAYVFNVFGWLAEAAHG
jgi:hypothetical protein